MPDHHPLQAEFDAWYAQAHPSSVSPAAHALGLDLLAAYAAGKRAGRHEGPPSMKVIIAGSRTIHSIIPIIEGIRASGFKISEVVSGGARGVDAVGEAWAKVHDTDFKVFPADWKTYGKSAGPRRNRQMAEYADALVAIWDGESPGTRNMIEQMKRLGKPVYVHTIKESDNA